jgi:hypothetical protein
MIKNTEKYQNSDRDARPEKVKYFLKHVVTECIRFTIILL